MHGYLLVKPINTDRKRINPSTTEGTGRSTDVVFLGDGLEKIDGVHSDILKNVGMYIGKKEILEVFSEFTYGEVAYIKKKNPKLIRSNLQHGPALCIRKYMLINRATALNAE